MNDTLTPGSEEWIKVDPVKKFRELSNTAFSEGMVAHKSEKELVEIVMAIFLQILREEDLHRDRDFFENLREIAGQIHTACEEQERTEKQNQTPDAHTTTGNFRERFLRIFRKAA